eukprot:363096-Chlamydomonas_euryale.AAC.1
MLQLRCRVPAAAAATATAGDASACQGSGLAFDGAHVQHPLQPPSRGAQWPCAVPCHSSLGIEQQASRRGGGRGGCNGGGRCLDRWQRSLELRGLRDSSWRGGSGVSADGVAWLASQQQCLSAA